MAHYDTFRHCLFIKYPAYGHALWEPNPGNLYPSVEVGDVGYIREGKFHRIFNALLSADHPSHANFGVPMYYEPLQPPVVNHINHGRHSPNDFCSGVTVKSEATTERSIGSGEVSFSCTGKGAVLSLPVAAQREDTILSAHFGKWIIKHIDAWFAFARALGLGIQVMEDIILVTGCHRTRSWVNIAFLGGQVDTSVILRVNVDPASRVNFDLSPVHLRGAMINVGPSGEDLPEDQCIFIRGFRVTRKLKILPPRLKAAAEPKPDPRGNDHEPDMEVVPNVAKYQDPLHLLSEYIAKRAPPCDMVLVHDDDLERILGAADRTSLETLQSGVVMDCFERSKPEIGVMSDYFPTSDQSSRTDTEHITVAMLSEQLRSWDSPTTVPLVSYSPGGTTDREEKAHILSEAQESATKYAVSKSNMRQVM